LSLGFMFNYFQEKSNKVLFLAALISKRCV